MSFFTRKGTTTIMDSSSLADQTTIFDAATLAKTTRKTLERLAPFCQMSNPSSSDGMPVINKIIGKIHLYINAIDTSILAAQVGYKLASDAMVFCDPTVMGAGWDGLVSPEGLGSLAAQGLEYAEKAHQTLKDVQQDMYKIATYTKDNNIMVHVHPDPGHPNTLRKSLKEVGSDLVANLGLLSQFSSAVANHENWWHWVNDELTAKTTENSVLLPVIDDQTKFLRWQAIKVEHQNYYNVISDVHSRYPAFLSSSTAAWQAVAIAQPVLSPSSSTAHMPLSNSSSDEAIGHVKSDSLSRGGVKSVLEKFRRSKTNEQSAEKHRGRSEERSVEGRPKKHKVRSDSDDRNTEITEDGGKPKKLCSRTSSIIRDAARNLGFHGCLTIM